MTAGAFTKDPASRLDWVWDWTDWLAAGETITAQTVTAPDGLTVEPPTHADGKVTVWISGGTTGKVYRVTCQITTDSGRIDERSITIRVIER